MKMKKPKQNKAFTLIELIVAMSIFIIVISAVLSLFNMALKAQRRVVALQNIEENARFALEFMAKEIRMGIINNSTSSTLQITRSDGEIVTYAFSGNRLERVTSDPSESGSLTSDEVMVNGSFYVEGITDGDLAQPKATIVLEIQGVGLKKEEQAKVNIQTTISQRNLDI